MRLIDANEINKNYDELKVRSYGDIHKQIKDSQILALYISAVDACKTIDAVPVVRCKNCEHYYRGICERPIGDGFSGLYVEMPEDGFCSDGERKDNG